MKILEKLNGLNGWQRIFFAFIVFIYLPIAILTISEDTYIYKLTDEQLVKLMPTELLTEIVNGKAFWVKPNPPKGFISDNLDSDKFTFIDYDFGYNWGYQLAISKSVGEANTKVIGEKVGKALGNEYSKKSFWARLEQFFFFLLGAIAMYVFGWTIGWIKKGFKEKKESI